MLCRALNLLCIVLFLSIGHCESGKCEVTLKKCTATLKKYRAQVPSLKKKVEALDSEVESLESKYEKCKEQGTDVSSAPESEQTEPVRKKAVPVSEGGSSGPEREQAVIPGPRNEKVCQVFIEGEGRPGGWFVSYSRARGALAARGATPKAVYVPPRTECGLRLPLKKGMSPEKKLRRKSPKSGIIKIPAKAVEEFNPRKPFVIRRVRTRRSDVDYWALDDWTLDVEDKNNYEFRFTQDSLIAFIVGMVACFVIGLTVYNCCVFHASSPSPKTVKMLESDF